MGFAVTLKGFKTKAAADSYAEDKLCKDEVLGVNAANVAEYSDAPDPAVVEDITPPKPTPAPPKA